MKFTLHKIVLENFKTYEGRVVIGPLKEFVGVIGPNGVGKSNLLDAISYALGEKISALRVKAPSELIYGAHVGKPVSRKASVCVVFQYEDGTSCSFQRTVAKSSQHYSWNNETVSSAVYFEQLVKMGINIKAKNILVYQGRVEDIAMMDGKERTAMFEESSGSKEFVREYEELKKEMNECGNQTHDVYSKKRTFKVLYNSAKQERNEAMKHDQLKNELANKIVELQLFKLFHNQKDVQKVEESIKLKQSTLKEAENIKEQVEKELKQSKKALGLASREVARLENDSHSRGENIKKLSEPLIKAKEDSRHLAKKIEMSLASLNQAREAHKKHLQNIATLSEELSKVEEEQTEYETKAAEESLSQGINMELEQSQVDDYNKKKAEVATRSAKYQQKLVSLTRKQKLDQDSLDNEKRKCLEIESLIKQKTHEAEEWKRRCEKLSERTSEKKKEQEKLKVQQESLSTDCSVFKEKMDCMQNELDDVLSQLGNAHMDRHEENRRKKKYQVITSLKERFPGVFDRLINLCKPIHQKYSIAITKVMGKYVDAIVVDKQKTAHLCIRYLREQMMEPETFLPLDFLEVKPLKDHLRHAKFAQKCCLLYDALEFDPPEIKRAVLFAAKSVVVCETAEAARQVAFNLDSDHPADHRRRLDVVALDGTYFQKGGLISGGSVDLARKARRWDEKQVDYLKERKDKLYKDLKDVNKNLRAQADLSVIQCEINGYSSRIRLMEEDLKKSEAKVEQLTEEVDNLKTKLQNYEPSICEIENRIKETGCQLKTLENKLCAIEDEVFIEFCARIGVPNLRAYEESGLRAYEERAKKRIEFEERRHRIQNQLDYETTLNTESNVTRWSDRVHQSKDALDSSKLVEDKLVKKIEIATRDFEQHVEMVSGKKKELDTLELNVNKIQSEVKQASQSVEAARKELTGLENQLENLLRSRKSLLVHCAVEGISIPILEGNLETLIPGRMESSTENSSSASASTSNNNSHATTSSIIIDFDELGDNLRTRSDVQELCATLTQNIAALTNKLESLKAPNLRGEGNLEETSERLRDTNVEFNTVREQARKAKKKFEKIQRLRFNRFMECFDFVSNEVDNVYKQITQSTSAMALLTADDPEEPYLSGISFVCVAPGKACKPMQSLSGGEKTIASLALLIAFHKYRAAPFIILDEMDAALDGTNIGKVANFFCSQKVNFQTVAISLRPEFYCHSDALIGITRDGTEDPKSKAFVFDLTKYPM